MLIASTWILTVSSAHQPLTKCHGKEWLEQQREGIESRKQGDFILFYSHPGLRTKSFSVSTAVESNQKGDKTIALVLYLMLNEIK